MPKQTARPSIKNRAGAGVADPPAARGTTAPTPSTAGDVPWDVAVAAGEHALAWPGADPAGVDRSVAGPQAPAKVSGW